ncbi:NADH-quinone oxidoreductase subunit J family protein [Coprobacter tertius]|uniref:NADH-quinone oxidoreductase subunit J n=1 Tax=Coprobacter tertius TaxID=2944915 RepID=A0ABT1MFW4_9BACT|nr:NADH-quinone oxidoreductase subunit J [Coprobacter tertius]MCP9611530.1 NADH-quinone oxidoreductase subunit J [Coprobacter tertius]
MEQVANQVIFYVLSAAIVIFSVLTVTTRRILRAATYLLFVLFATAGLYFQLDYHFLGAVQLAVYAGGIVVLFVFSILLTSSPGEKSERIVNKKRIRGLVAAFGGGALCLYALLTHVFSPSMYLFGSEELDMKQIGHALMGMEKYQYILPFEALSVLLLACIIGGIMIARKR